MLQITYERGYFNSPRVISLREIAAMFDVSIYTMSGIPLKAQRKLVAERFGD